MIITIDGPAGSGKSTVARMLAARLGVAYLDTGAMYRAIAHAAIQRGVDTESSDALLELARSVELNVTCGASQTRVEVDSVDVTEEIRTMAVNAVTSKVAKCSKIRAILVQQQQRIGRKLGSLVSEGRDQGSVVFPEADAKFVLDASLSKRAERRFLEMLSASETVTFEEIENNLRFRDDIDSKQWEPLLRSGEAIVIDTTDLSLPQVVERMAEVLADGVRR
jgi:cytidylate kinase